MNEMKAKINKMETGDCKCAPNYITTTFKILRWSLLWGDIKNPSHKIFSDFSFFVKQILGTNKVEYFIIFRTLGYSIIGWFHSNSRYKNLVILNKISSWMHKFKFSNYLNKWNPASYIIELHTINFCLKLLYNVLLKNIKCWKLALR